MLVVKIEMWPYGNAGRAYEIGRTYIANDGSGSADRGDYKVAVCRRGSTEVPREIYETQLAHLEPDDAREFMKDNPKAARAAEVKDYPRQAYNVWRLIARAVLAAFPEESKRAKRDERTLLDPQVMLGLRSLREIADAAPCALGDGQFSAREAARAWLDASTNEAQP